MKKIVFFTVIMFSVFSMPMCTKGSKDASAPSNASGTVDPVNFARDSARNAPEDVLVGVGSAKESSTSMSITVAVNRAKEEISRQISVIVQNMMRDYIASTEVNVNDAIYFQESVARTLYNSSLSGVSIADEGTDADGNYWAAVYMSIADVSKEINQAVALAKQQYPGMSSFVPDDRLYPFFLQIKQGNAR